MNIYLPHSEAKPKPSTAFLITLNGLIFFGLLVIDATIFGLILAIPSTMIFMLISGILQLIIRHTIERRRFLLPLPRFAAYLSPLCLPILLSLISPSPFQEANQKSPTRSPDGTYEARISAPTAGWKIKISEVGGKKDWIKQTEFVSHLNIYWAWDADNRFWIRNSDDGSIYFIEKRKNNWNTARWGNEWEGKTEDNIPTDIAPPKELLSSYKN